MVCNRNITVTISSHTDVTCPGDAILIFNDFTEFTIHSHLKNKIHPFFLHLVNNYNGCVNDNWGSRLIQFIIITLIVFLC